MTTYNKTRHPDIISLPMEEHNTTYEALQPKQEPGSGQPSRGSHYTHVVFERLKWGSSKLVCAVIVKHTPNHKDSV